MQASRNTTIQTYEDIQNATTTKLLHALRAYRSKNQSRRNRFFISFSNPEEISLHFRTYRKINILP